MFKNAYVYFVNKLIEIDLVTMTRFSVYVALIII